MKKNNTNTDELTASGFRIIALLYWCGTSLAFLISLFLGPKLFVQVGQPDVSMFQREWSLLFIILGVALAVIAIVPPRRIIRNKTIFSICFTLALLPIASVPFFLIRLLRSLTGTHPILMLIACVVYCTIIMSLPWYLHFHWRQIKTQERSK